MPADLLDRAALEAAVATMLAEWGHIDLLLNNGRYIGPGHMDSLLDTPLDLLEKHLAANVMAPLALTKLVLPQMIERGHGLVLQHDLRRGMDRPTGAGVGQGGWGLGYAISKGALHRVAGVLAHELAGTGVYVVNVSPGFVATERIVIDMADFGFDARRRRTARAHRPSRRVVGDERRRGRAERRHHRGAGRGGRPRLHLTSGDSPV